MKVYENIGEVVGNTLVTQAVRKNRQDSTRQRDVTHLHGNAGDPGEGANHRKEGLGRQGGSLVRPGVDNRGGVGHGEGMADDGLDAK